MRARKIVEANYYRFCHLEGNECIASEFALLTILELIKKFEVHSILELGMGIGSISDTVLRLLEVDKLNATYDGTEANEFCRNALKKNVTYFSKLNLYRNLAEVSDNKRFDLIIVDGQDNSLYEITKHCKKDTIIFIEGDRAPQRELIMTLFPKALHVNIISLKKNKDYAHGSCETIHYVGGGQLIFIDPTTHRKLFWFKEKVKAYLKRRIRNYKKRKV